jgi:hypothetical protein
VEVRTTTNFQRDVSLQNLDGAKGILSLMDDRKGTLAARRKGLTVAGTLANVFGTICRGEALVRRRDGSWANSSGFCKICT